MKRLLSIWLLLLPIIAMAQLKHDANWVFGERCGVDFTDPNNPVSFYPATKNDEPNASISDSAGNLQLYLSYNRTYSWMPAIIRDGEHDTVLNSEGINIGSSITNGAVFLPVPGKNDSIYLFHVGTFAQTCNLTRCYRLYYSLIAKDSNVWRVTDKNIILTTAPVNESISIVKHSNGIDFWMYIHGQRINHPDSCSNRFIRFLISENGITGPFMQEIGESFCSEYSFYGELTISKDGRLLASVIAGDNKVGIYSINRCTGLLAPNMGGQVIRTGGEMPYSIEFSNYYIYVSIEQSGAGRIYKYDLRELDISQTREIMAAYNIPNLSVGQMELLDSNTIVFCTKYIGFDSMLVDYYGKHLHAITNASQVNSTIVNEYLYLGDSAKTGLGLTHFPNYNLGPEGVFLANAGKDTVLCSNTNSIGITIGTPPVPNVTYLWQPALGLSATTIAQPTANPAQSMWYYLTATDTTATSCAVNTDSVYVKVETCTGITETPSGERWDYRLKPNLFHGGKTATINLVIEETGTVEIYNIQGALVGSYKVEQGKNVLTLDKSLAAAGVYIYKVYTGNQLRHTDKLVVVE